MPTMLNELMREKLIVDKVEMNENGSIDKVATFKKI